jgi:nickel-dependent lactate racemase
VKKSFQLGGHKAAAIAMVSNKASIWMVSDLPEEIVKLLFATPFNKLDKAIHEALLKLGKDSRILVMPVGGSTLPEVTKSPKFKD